MPHLADVTGARPRTTGHVPINRTAPEAGPPADWLSWVLYPPDPGLLRYPVGPGTLGLGLVRRLCLAGPVRLVSLPAGDGIRINVADCRFVED
jgi:hypothetical protein